MHCIAELKQQILEGDEKDRERDKKDHERDKKECERDKKDRERDSKPSLLYMYMYVACEYDQGYIKGELPVHCFSGAAC